MNIDEYNEKYSKNSLKAGYTTGTCAAAAAKAAFMILEGKDVLEVRVSTPAGIDLNIPVLDIKVYEKSASCAVRKYSGDDPDITDGMLIYAHVSIKNINRDKTVRVFIEGGRGIGRITRPGLEQKVGEAAINAIPREMIKRHITECAENMKVFADIEVLIYAPCGKQIAKKTFNPKLGIEGGISILGTTGMVTPMSKAALIDTIKVEMKMRLLNSNIVIGVPGNYGLEFTKKNYGISDDMTVEFSNYIGEAIDCAVALDASGLLLIGHIGKFVKAAAGIMNTHSNEADARAEVIAAHVLKAGISEKQFSEYIFDDAFIKKRYLLALKILNSNTTVEAVRLLKDENMLESVMNSLADSMYSSIMSRAQKAFYMLRKNKKIQYTYKEEGAVNTINTQSDIKMSIGIITFTNEDGELARAGKASELLKQIKNAYKSEEMK